MTEQKGPTRAQKLALMAAWEGGASFDEYRPRKRQREILDRALGYVGSVQYQVTARWLFYRLLQDGIYAGKGDYNGKFLPMLSKARKRFYNGWRPDTLADDTREAVIRGDGFDSEGDWLSAVGRARCNLDKWAGQPCYVELWFEAKAMRGQFEYYTDHVTLVAFGGDPSIPYKWDVAKRLEERAETCEQIVILYFGDLDPKGLTIPKSAAADIQDWCAAPFEFIRCALNLGDEVRYGIPENPDKPGQYQWEALSDEVAGKLITESVGKFVSPGYFSEIEGRERAITARFKKRWAELLDGNGRG